MKTVYACVDFMGTSFQTTDEEYAEIKKEIEEVFKDEEVIFKQNVFPHKLANENIDIYVFDWGGLLPGCEDLTESHYRDLIKQIEDHPNTLFLLISSFTQRWYKDLMEDESKELDQFNVIFGLIDEEKILNWFNGIIKK